MMLLLPWKNFGNYQTRISIGGRMILYINKSVVKLTNDTFFCKFFPNDKHWYKDNVEDAMLSLDDAAVLNGFKLIDKHLESML